ncbi:hypothetical protein [Dorea sp. D27]|uniref:hypothetical protein n=1 Tax=Dorea sp. D27 TaxID=658665 RepID=UPI0011C91F52|nr:hypothetical protein [Dorea sp. D27]
MANAPYTTAKGTSSVGGIAHKVGKRFKVKVMFITRTKVICKVVGGLQKKKEDLTVEAVKEGEEFISPVSTKDDTI